MIGAWSRNISAFRAGKRVGAIGDLSAPRALAIGSDGLVYAVVSSDEQILVLSEQLTVQGNLAGRVAGVRSPSDIQFVRNDTLALSEASRHLIRIVRISGDVLLTIGSGRPGRGRFSLRRPSGLERHGTHLWIADAGNDRVIRCILEMSGS